MVTPTPPPVTPEAAVEISDTLLWRQSFDGRLGRIEANIDNRFDKLEAALASGIKSAVEVTVKGFPNDDLHGHRTLHEQAMERAESIKKRKEEVVTHLFKTGSWVVLGFIALTVWTYIKIEVQK
jgi:hypothetical protein